VGELYKPGRKVGRDLLTPDFRRRIIEEIQRLKPEERRIALKCTLCNEIFVDLLQAYLHQLEHERKGEKPCFIILTR